MAPATPDSDSVSALQRYRRRFREVPPERRDGGPVSDAEERLFLLSNASNDAIWDCNWDTHSVWWNETYEKLFGRRRREDASADWWIERIHPDDREPTIGGLEAALNGSASHWIAEYRFRKVDGSFAPIRDRTLISRREDGSPRRITSAKADLSEQRRLEAELHNTSSILQSFYDSVPICMGVAEIVDDDFEFLHANPACCQILRLDPAEVRGSRLSRTGMPADIRAGWLQRYREAHATGQPVRFEYYSPVSDRWFSATVSEAAGGESGRPRVVFTAENITSYKRSLEERREAEERFRRLYESTIIGIVSGDEEAARDANDVFLQMMGYTREDLSAGRLRWYDITAPEFRHLGPATVADVKSTGAYGPFEKEYLRKDGSRVPVLLGCVRLQDAPYRELCFVLDLSERKRLERRMMEAQKLESVGVLAGGIAHDFNNLLVGVIGHAGLVQDMLPAGHPAHELLHEVVKSGEQAAHLTRQMLAYSGRGQFVLEPVNLSALFEEISILVKPALAQDIVLEMHLPPNLPTVEADRGQMSQVFTNLVLNAAESLTGQGGKILVKTGARELDDSPWCGEWAAGELLPGEYVYLEVADNGAGMDDATRARIFDPFYTTKFVGRGLGLAAVAGIVRGHKGAISVTSAPGQGSRFLVLFPAAAAARATPRTGETSATVGD